MVFSVPRMERSAILVQQVLIYGSVRDGLTPDVGPRGALLVQLLDRDTGGDYPLKGKVLPDATYAFYGLPQTAFPLIASQTYHLRIEAAAPGYLASAIDFDLGPAANQPQVTSRPLALPQIPPMQVILFTAPNTLLPRRIDFMLDRSAVRLRGRVVQAANPAQGINNATIQAGAQTAATDAQGFYTFPLPLPVTLSLPITATANGFDPKTVTFEPDYTRAINELIFALTT